MASLLSLFTRGFVLWVLLFSCAAWFFPAPFAALAPGIRPGLGLIMFGMGMTLLPADFARVARMPRAVGAGLLGQFLIMPLLAVALARGFRLPPELAMGFIILGCCPGGTASNVIAYLARADVALSVTMTACSTLVAVVLTPLLIKLLGGQYLPVDAWALFLDVVQIVFIPVVLGLGVRVALRGRIERWLDLFPALSVLIIVLIIAAIVALTRGKLIDVAGLLLVLVVAHNALGLALGYGLAWLFRLPEVARRTIAIEVGMQNSGLGVALAAAHYGAASLVTLPASAFSVIHNLTGSALANWWGQGRRRGG